MKNKAVKQTKSKLRRITALLLALLLTVATMSPALTLHAEDIDTLENAETSENNSDRDSGGHQTGDGSDGGGHQVEGGESSQRPTNVPSDFEISVKFETQKYGVTNYHYSFSYLEGDGRFNVRTVVTHNTANDSVAVCLYIFSDKPFRMEMINSYWTDNNTPVSRTYDMNISTLDKSGYYMLMPFTLSANTLESYTVIGPNRMNFNVENMSNTEIFDAILNSLNFTEGDSSGSDDGSSGDSSGSDDGSSGDSSGSDDGSSNGPNNDSDGVSDIPDLDIDFSNIFTLIASIVKAFLKFITFLLSLLLETFTTLLGEIGQFSSLIGSIFAFLPSSIISVMLSGIVVIIFVGILRK